MNENVNLDDLMGATKPHSSNVFDITSGNSVIHSEENTTEPVKRTTMKAVPVQSGPIDMSSVKPIDINSILPKREPKVNPMEASMMADLDAAIDRECSKITELHQQILDKQEEERQAAEDAEEEKRLAAQDEFALNGTLSDEDDVGLYDDKDDFDMTTTNTQNMQRFNMMSEDENTSYNTDIPIPTTDHDEATITIMNNPSPIIVEESDNNTNSENTTTVASEKKEPSILDTVKDEDLFDDEEEESESVSAEEIVNDLKMQVKERIAPKRNKLDLSKFTIAKKAISAQKVMKLVVGAHQNVADWVLPSANRAISMTGLSGPEILKLNPENSNRNRQNTFRDMYRIIYDHVFDGNKPDFEVWLKQTRFVDLQHIYFALYMATFGGSNFINYSCPKCNKVFIKDIDFKDMVIYANDEVKSKIQSMLKMDTTSKSNDSYEAELVQVSDSYVFAIRTPSIWNVIIETSSLSDKFLEKHADLIDMVAYIDAAYIIDHDTNQLIPVDTKPDPNDMAKTAARRIKAMYDIISSLSSGEYYALRSNINEYDEFANTSINYQIPACTCPHCATEIPANSDITPDAMLFMRHQLEAIGSM